MSEIWNDPVLRPILAVLAFGAVAYVLSRATAAVGRLLALAAGICVIVCGAFLAAEVPTDCPLVGAIAVGQLSLPIRFAVTHLGCLVGIGAGAFAVLIALYSFRGMAGEYWEGKFYAYLIWALAGACLVGWAGSFFTLLLGWELVTVMLFLMLNQGQPGAEIGAAKTYGVLGFADACLLLAVALMLSPGVAGKLQPGQPMYNLALPARAAPLLAGSLGAIGYAIYALLLVAALAKAGAVPLHTWLPAAAERAPVSVMAYLPAALDKLLGIYLLARVALDVFRPDHTMQLILMSIGAVTIIAAVFMAMMQHNLKRLLSFHAVSQVGYMVLGIGTGTALGIVGGLFHMLNNAIYKSGLFLMSGTVGRAAGSDEIEDMGGLARRLPVTFVCGAVAAAAISGVPPFNGFVSKWLVYQGALSLHSGLGAVMLVVAVFGSALTLASFVKVLYSAFLSRPPVEAAARIAAARENFSMAAPMVVLAAGCVVLGLFPHLVVGNVLVPAVQPVLPKAAEEVGSSVWGMAGGEAGQWSPFTAFVLIVLGILGGVVLLGIFALKKVRVVRPFLGGELGIGEDRYRMPGTGFYETVKRMPALKPLLEHGERGAMDLYRWFGRYGGGVVQTLRAQHTGLISLYVAWVMVGLAAVLAYLLMAGYLKS